MQRRLVVASAIAVAMTAAFLPGSGVGSSAAAVRRAQTGIPAGLAAAIHARFGAGAIRSAAAAPETEGPYFGYSVALSADGTTALVGAPAVDHDAGAAYVFHVSDPGSWSSSATPTATLTHASTGIKLLGYTAVLSADGTTAFVSAPGAGGAIYVFHVSAEDAWTSSSTPTATLKVGNAFNLGIGKLALSTDATTLVVGAPLYNAQAGGAYVFHASSEAAWTSVSTPTATLTYAAESGSDSYVGSAVAISGDGTTALVSDAGNQNGGGAFVYHVLGEGAWTDSSTPNAILTDPAMPADGLLGLDLGLSGDGTVGFLGAIGAVDVFDTSGEAAWATTSTPTATLTTAGGPWGGFFGQRLGVSTDGTTALVNGADGERGVAYVFHVGDEKAWASTSTPTATLTDAGVPASKDPNNLGEIGVLSADGGTALVGSPFIRFQTGAADVFHVADASSWTSTSTPTAILTDSALARCVVPRLKGRTVRVAKATLKARSCRLGKVTKVRSRSAKKGRVISQSVKRGIRLPVGAKISVKVAR